MYTTKISNCNTRLLEKQKSALINEIINGQNRSYIKVFDLEPGVGKTRASEQGIAKGVKNNQKYILVRQFNNDCEESANIINNLYGGIIALAFNNEVFPTQVQRTKIEKTFNQYPVLVITHAKYMALMKNPQKRKVFCEGRNNLVIDEFINTVVRLQLTYNDINTLKVFFDYDHELLYQYLNIVKQLQDEFIGNPTGKNIIRINLKSHKKQFAAFKRCIRANITTPLLKKRVAAIKKQCPENINLELLDSINTVSQLVEKIEELHQFFNCLCLIDRGIIYTTDTRCKMWLLNNNIMLDASGGLQIAYTLDQKLYKLAGCEKVLNHSNWTLTNVKLETTNAGIGRVVNYYEQVNRIAKECGDSTLVITNKADMQYIDVPESRKAYHYNIVGSNKWADLQNVVVAQTPNIDDAEYILKLLHYSRGFIENIPSLSTKATGKQGRSRYSFNDPRLEQIRVLHIAETIYQGIKRVNRCMEHDTKAVIIMNNDDVMELLRMQLSGCTLETLTADEFIIKQNKRDIYNQKQKEQSFGTKFMNLIVELQGGKHPELQYTDKKGITHKGKYKKSTIREYLGIGNKNNFNMTVLSKTDIITFCKIRGINTDGQYITLPVELTLTG